LVYYVRIVSDVMQPIILTECFCMINIFVNEKEKRPRAGWRILLQFTLFILFLLGMLYANEVLINSNLDLYRTLAMCIAAVGSVWVAAALIDQRRFTDFGIGWNRLWKKELLFGLFIGGLSISLIFAVAWSLDWIRITGYGWNRSSNLPYLIWFCSYLAAMVLVGFYEELLFRGYQILNLVEGLQKPGKNPFHAAGLAILISSLFFGVMHAGNPSASWISTLNIVIAGVVLGIPYLYTGRLALSIGIHISWNFLQGGVFGFPVSGSPFRGSLVQIKNVGADIVTGSSFGPEAGLLGLFGLCIILGLCISYLRYSEYFNNIHTSFIRKQTNLHKLDEQGS